MSNKQSIMVWDIFVRIFHWTLVASFLVAYLTSEEENPLHIYAGYTVLGLVIFRIILGFVGSQYARFSDFITSPAAVIEYMNGLLNRNPKHYLGHNPLGGWMVLAMLVMLLVVTFSGIKLYAIEEGKGPFAMHIQQSLIANAYAKEDEDDDNEIVNENNSESEEVFWEELHELSTNLMLILIGLHISGVIISSRFHKENLVKAMLTGRKER